LIADLISTQRVNGVEKATVRLWDSHERRFRDRCSSVIASRVLGAPPADDRRVLAIDSIYHGLRATAKAVLG
jgi:hypothetical protein